jgi:hypothetical protein
LRIFDRIASGEYVFKNSNDKVAPEILSMLRKSAHEYQRIIADEAAQFIAQSDVDWIPQRGDFGVMRPPFDHTWIEYAAPSHLFHEGQWVEIPHRHDMAILVESYDGNANLFGLVGYRSRITVMPIYINMQRIDSIEHLTEQVVLLHSHDELHNVFGDDVDAHMLSMFGPAYLALGWINCRGVELESARLPGWRAKKRARKGQPAGLDYRRIILDGRLTKSLERNKTAAQQGQRLHIVRGHIRNYTSERPAFGTYVGNMWINQHMRGDASLGQINHEYHVTKGSR